MRLVRAAAMPIALGVLLLLPAPAAADSHELTIRVVPPLPGARFSLDGRVFVANERGVARISTGGPGTYMLKALPYREDRDSVRAEFARWGDEVFAPTRRLEIPGTTDLEVGFELYHPVTLRFVDLEGRPVDTDRVDGVLVRSSTGQEIEFDGTGPEWLKATRSLRRRQGLEAKPLLYSVQEVAIDGSNAVNKSEHRFVVEGPAEWDLRLLLFSATFRSKDAVFGMTLGSHMVIEYPDGSVHRVPLHDGVARLEALVRGSYLAHVEAPGYSPPMPISLSREGQEAVLKVLSWFDVGLFLFLMAALAIGLLLLGRPHLARRVLRALRLRSRPPDADGGHARDSKGHSEGGPPYGDEGATPRGYPGRADAPTSGSGSSGRGEHVLADRIEEMESGIFRFLLDTLAVGLLLLRRPHHARRTKQSRRARSRPRRLGRVFSLRSNADEVEPEANGFGTRGSDEDDRLVRRV